MIVYGVIRSGTWGFVQPKPDAPQWLGMSPVVWLLLGGGAVLVLFALWESRRLRRQQAALLDPQMLKVPRLQGGLTSFFFQFMLQAGLFFVIPLFLSVALGLSAVATGVRLLPLSITLLAECRRRAEALPARLAAADRAGRLRPAVPRHRRAPGGAGLGSRRGHRDRAAPPGRARHRHSGLAARGRHRLGGARLAERRSRRRAEHRHEPRRLHRHRPVGRHPHRRAHHDLPRIRRLQPRHPQGAGIARRRSNCRPAYPS